MTMPGDERAAGGSGDGASGWREAAASAMQAVRDKYDGERLPIWLAREYVDAVAPIILAQRAPLPPTNGANNEG